MGSFRGKFPGNWVPNVDQKQVFSIQEFRQFWDLVLPILQDQFLNK
jgi:hypothetical protein